MATGFSFRRMLLATLGIGCVAPVSAHVSEVVYVTATRLPDRETDRERVPASTTVITREEIERRGAGTLQDLLALEAGVVVYDQVGNDVQKTFDLRGFTGGDSLAVFVDGARVNDPRNNLTSLESIPMEAVERIEITRGSAAATAGGGAEAGIIHIHTRRGLEPGGLLSVAAGTYGSTRLVGEWADSSGPLDFFLSGALDATDGFRENTDGDQKRFAASAGLDVGESRLLRMTLLYSDLEYGNPGALREDEYATDPSASTFNLLDFTEALRSSATLNFVGPLAGRLSLAADLAYRNEQAETLTTGRGAASFGGFFLDADTATWGSTVQITHATRGTGDRNELVVGLEGLAGENRSTGFFTPPSSPGSVDRSNPASRNSTNRTTTAFYVQDTFQPSERWSLTAGCRYDRDHFRYDENVPDAANDDARTFSEVSLKAGATWRANDRLDVHVAYGEAFLPPTVEQLFAFPLFFSNPDLDPEDSRSVELGLGGEAFGARFEVAAFQIDTEDEIVFDPSAGTFGMNVNAGRTRRRGFELSGRGSAGSVGWFVNASVADATLREGPDRGNTVPLVPTYRASYGVDAPVGAGFVLHMNGLFVGEQVLDSDPENAEERLSAYFVLNARVSWSRGARGVRLFVEARNALDQGYATRGIFAADLSTPFPWETAVFLTPAPGRRWLAGAEWRF